MAKIPKNAEKFLIQWNSIVSGGDNTGDSIPSSADIIWGNNTYTWGDVAFIQEIVDGIGTGSRRAREARIQQFDNKKKKKLIHLICRVKGEKVYDDKKETLEDTEIKIEDVDMVINEILGKMKVETKDVI